MSRNNKYPQINEHRDQGPGAQCGPCANLKLDTGATHWVRVEFTYMRGEDEVAKVCPIHLAEIRCMCNHKNRGKPWPTFWQDGVWK